MSGNLNSRGFLEASVLSGGSVWIVLVGIIIIICAVAAFIFGKKKDDSVLKIKE